MDMNNQNPDTVVIGAGQAGLATGFHLQRRGLEFIILDEQQRVGEVWRTRWESLRLFTPAQHDGLPGLPFPAARGSLPGKDAMAGYLQDYARHFALPLRHGIRVTDVESEDGRFRLETTSGTLTARNLVVASGAHSQPRIPPAAQELAPDIHQLHTARYQDPGPIPPGDVLVVGSGTSGVEIALELAREHQTFVAGTAPFHVPDPVLRYAGGVYWQFVHHVLTRATPLGRKVAAGFTSRGAPLLRASVRDLEQAGVARVPRLAGTRHGQPLLTDGRILPVRTVVWATGYGPGLDWIRDLPVEEGGWPVTVRGAVEQLPGLYFVGMPFQFALTSALVGGVGRDADYVAACIAERSKRS